jgi:hypothetical protein
LTRRIDEGGNVVRGPWRFDTVDVAAPRARMRRVLRYVVAGDMIYGLARAGALDRVGSYQPVLIPDRLLLAELAREGEFVQVPELLWTRRFAAPGNIERQRRVFWLDGAPWWTRAPWWLTHAAVAARRHGPGAFADHLANTAFFTARARLLGARNAAVLPVVRRPRGRRAARRALPAIRETRAVLERLVDDAER